MTNKIIEAARDSDLLDHRDTVGTVPGCYAKALERFYAIAYRQGLEDAAKVCDEQQTEGECPERASYCAEAIRALKDQDAAIAAGKGEVNG